MQGLRRFSVLVMVVLFGVLPGFVGLDTALAAGTTYYVAPGGTGDCTTGQSFNTPLGTIQSALDCAATDTRSGAATADSPDTIDIAAGTYDERLWISANVRLMSVDGDVVINGTHHTFVVWVNPSFTVGISGLTITNGTVGILNSGNLTLNQSSVTHNVNECSSFCLNLGGGISNDGVLTLNHSLVMSNTAACSGTCFAGGGGIYFSYGAVTLHHSHVKKNTPDNCAPSNSIAGCSN